MLFSGNVGVAQSVLAEVGRLSVVSKTVLIPRQISSVDTQARTLSYLPLAYAFGSIVVSRSIPFIWI